MDCSILVLPNEVLRQRSQPIERFDSSLTDKAQVLKKAMRSAGGIGLAAVQVGLHEQLLVMKQDPHAAFSSTLVMINPAIVSKNGLQRNHEGCLSVPSGRVWVERPAEVIVRYLNEKGKEKSILLKGLAAACVQHEMDHFEGVLIPDYLARFHQE